MEKKITIGAGCFWCSEAVFENLKGVLKVQSGYSGGKIANPTYREVCSGLTGHAEVIQISYEDTILDLKMLLEVFFKTHDPTSLNRQGGDHGTQYRSAIFYHNEKQKKEAEEFKNKLDKTGYFDKPIVTEITEFKAFYPAEEEHKTYYKNNPEAAYCQMVVRPKVEKAQKMFAKNIK